MVHQNPAYVFVATLELLHIAKCRKHQIKHAVGLVCLPLHKLCRDRDWYRHVVGHVWTRPLRTSLREGDMISFRVEMGSGKPEAVNVELI